MCVCVCVCVCVGGWVCGCGCVCVCVCVGVCGCGCVHACVCVFALIVLSCHVINHAYNINSRFTTGVKCFDRIPAIVVYQALCWGAPLLLVIALASNSLLGFGEGTDIGMHE